MATRPTARPAARPAARSAAAPSRSAATRAGAQAPRGAGRSAYRGAAGRARADEELERQKALQEQRRNATNAPFRFRLAPGETKQAIIVDDEPDFFRFEHNLQDPATGRWNIYCGCINEWDNCPVCSSAGREGVYTMYLTVIDLTPFETRDGETVEFSRKLLAVKPAQQKKFNRMYLRAQEEGRTLRGALVEFIRDGDKDSSIGNDIELLEFVSDDELDTYVREWEDREHKLHTEVCADPYDYDELFPEPTADELAALVGSAPAAGSRRQEERELGGRQSSRASSRPRGRDDELPEQPTRTRIRPTRQTAAARDDDADTDSEGEYEAPERTERMRPGSRQRPAADEPADEPPRGRAAARAARGRPEPAEEEQPEEERSTRTRPVPPGAGRRSVARR